MERRGFLAALLAVAAAPKRAIAEALERHRKEAARKAFIEEWLKTAHARAMIGLRAHYDRMFYGRDEQFINDADWHLENPEDFDWVPAPLFEGGGVASVPDGPYEWQSVVRGSH